jgi:hypothetical protein
MSERTEVLAEILAAFRELVGSHREMSQRSMLEAWDVETDELDREGVEKLWREIYQRKCEGDYGTEWTDRLAPLTSEDYEALDYATGWEEGYGAAAHIVAELYRAVAGQDES